MNTQQFESLTFKELITLTITIPTINDYLASFHTLVIEALKETSTSANAIPYRGEMTFANLGVLFKLMPDLYKYLKESYSLIESGGDAIINNILDETKEEKPYSNTRKEINHYFEYIRDTYYNEYLLGNYPTPYSIDDWHYSERPSHTFPRADFWWKNM
jgi:hypothetical protein